MKAVTLHPTVNVEVGKQFELMRVAQGRVILAVSGDRVGLYRQQSGDDYTCIFTHDLGGQG
jgi:hypothetical protein